MGFVEGTVVGDDVGYVAVLAVAKLGIAIHAALPAVGVDVDPESVDEPCRRVSMAADDDEVDVWFNEEMATVPLVED